MLLFLGNALWLSGFLDQARQRNREALQSARESRNLPVRAAVFTFASEYFIWTGEQDRLRESVDAFEAVQAELETIVGLPEFMEVRNGWLLIERGEAQEGIQSIRSGIANLQARNISMYGSFHAALLALAYKRANRIDDAFASINDALRFVEQSGERFYEAEIHRLRGEWLLAYSRASATGEIEGCFRKAIEIARKQEAKSWELRATTSLARLMRDTNCREEGRAMLAHICNWFTEGFDTSDLKEAKALLEQLGT